MGCREDLGGGGTGGRRQSGDARKKQPNLATRREVPSSILGASHRRNPMRFCLLGFAMSHKIFRGCHELLRGYVLGVPYTRDDLGVCQRLTRR